MLEQVELCFRHQGRAGGKGSFHFVSGLNVVIGPNGSGKSSLLRAIDQCPDCVRHQSPSLTYRYFNSETMNPHRDQKPFRGARGSLIKARAMFSSHGETMRDVLRFMPMASGDCLLLDEPEAGHDLNWVLKIRRALDHVVDRGCQVIIASHHPVFWRGANVIELEKNYLKKTLVGWRQSVGA
jgi:predicted ATPase